MRETNYYKRCLQKNKTSNSLWLSKILLSIILILVVLIINNINPNFKEKYNKNIRFVDINKLYEKYIGKLNIKKEEDVMTFNSIDNNVEKVNNYYKVNLEDNVISSLKPGIVVYIGEKDNLGKTIIIQGNDGVDLWYSNVSNTSYNLYDYVTNNDIIGNAVSNYYYLTIKKNDRYLEYEEYFI